MGCRQKGYFATLLQHNRGSVRLSTIIDLKPVLLRLLFPSISIRIGSGLRLLLLRPNLSHNAKATTTTIARTRDERTRVGTDMQPLLSERRQMRGNAGTDGI